MIKNTVVMIGVFMICLGCASATATSTYQGDPFGYCWTQYEGAVEKCNNDFHYPDNPEHKNQSAFTSCTRGAEATLDACTQGADHGGELAEAWSRFRGRLKQCLDNHEDDPIMRDSYIRASLIAYRAELRRVLALDDDDSCPSPEGGFEIGRSMAMLELAAIAKGNADGNYPTSVNTTLTVTAGVNPSADGSYDVKQISCIKSAMVLAIYATKDGTIVRSFDADLDTSNGTRFDIHLVDSEFVDAREVSLLCIFYDALGVPQFGELGTLAIQDTGIPGDWNRDEVQTTQDVIDYPASYTARTKRADVNGDNEVTPVDAQEFIDDYAG